MQRELLLFWRGWFCICSESHWVGSSCYTRQTSLLFFLYLSLNSSLWGLLVPQLKSKKAEKQWNSPISVKKIPPLHVLLHFQKSSRVNATLKKQTFPHSKLYNGLPLLINQVFLSVFRRKTQDFDLLMVEINVVKPLFSPIDFQCFLPQPCKSSK